MVFKSGGSLVVSIPSSFVEIVGVKSGDHVKVNLDYEHGTIFYTFTGTKQLMLHVQSQTIQKKT